jgi:cyclic pyranopterin phosphate synthase
MSAEALALVAAGELRKGDLDSVARIAGIQAAKRTAELIPLCHPLPLEHVAVTLDLLPELPGIRVTARVRTIGRTGVEMEALTAVAVALLTVYDMVKAVDPAMVIGDIALEEKRGGRRGTYTRPR